MIGVDCKRWMLLLSGPSRMMSLKPIALTSPPIFLEIPAPLSCSLGNEEHITTTVLNYSQFEECLYRQFISSPSRSVGWSNGEYLSQYNKENLEVNKTLVLKQEEIVVRRVAPQRSTRMDKEYLNIHFGSKPSTS